MRTINKKRAEMLSKFVKPTVDQVYIEPEDRTKTAEIDENIRALFDIYDMDCQFSVNGLVSKLLHSFTYSLKETSICKNCGESDIIHVSKLPIIGASNALKIDYGNLVAAIGDNFPDYKCDDCNSYKEVQREFGQHVFIEVNFLHMSLVLSVILIIIDISLAST